MKKTTTILTVSTLLFNAILLAQPVLPFAGNGSAGYSGDGGPATSASLNYISSFCGDAAGNIYISDFTNADVRKVTLANIISTVAGNQVQGFSGDAGLATVASLSVSTNIGSSENFDIAKDAAGNLYLNDFKNKRIRKVATTGIITTIAGNGLSGYTGDGGIATLAKINSAYMTVDAAGNVYFTDRINHVVRKINTSGIISTIAGTGVSGFSGDGNMGNLATLKDPESITVDAAGNLYISDIGNFRIRMVNAAGFISTYAGNGTSSYSGDGGLAVAAAVCPKALSISPLTGNLVFISMSNQPNPISFTGKCNIRSINSVGVIYTVRDSSFFLMGGGQYVQNIRSFYLDNSLNMYFSPDYNICVGFCSPGNCYKTSLTSTAAGIEVLDLNNSLVKLFPNPSNGNFSIETSLNEKASIDVYDINGKLIYSQMLLNSKNELMLNLPSGNYLANIKANGVSVKKQIIITK